MPANSMETRNRTRPQWTPTGLDCHQREANCESCPVHLTMGLHKDSPVRPCYQDEFNKRLIREGVRLPITLKPVLVSPHSDKPIKPVPRLSLDEGVRFRAEIVRIIRSMDSPAIMEIIQKLNDNEFLGYSTWRYEQVNGHIHNMKTAGVLKSVGMVSLKSARQHILAVADESKLQSMIRVNAPPVHKMPQMVIRGNEEWKAKAL